MQKTSLNLTANVVKARRRRRGRTNAEPVSGPDKYVSPTGITHLIDKRVFVTAETFGVRAYYEGALKKILPADHKGKGAGIALECSQLIGMKQRYGSGYRAIRFPVVINWRFVVNVQAK